MKEKIDFLKKHYLFNDYDEQSLSSIAEQLILRKYKKGNYIFMQGDTDRTLHFVVDGKIKIFHSSEDGVDKLITIFTKGDFLGEMDIIGKNIERAASAQALTDVKTYQMTYHNAIEFLSKTETAFKIIESLSTRITEQNSQIKLLIYGNAKQKLNYILKNMKEKYGVYKDGKIYLEVNISQRELGNMVGISRETVSRYLNELKGKGLVDIKNKKIVILDEEAFENLVEAMDN
ncbi:MAG: Crp/Fnr family transcriptional regulator [Tissierellales bacterium]|jgi:CRP/FNR family transcriptional regulator|nr:Crp/Fnr family transcriptional regulator [Tissierellales bacterium]